MLYQLTGEKKHAELGRQCFEKSLEGAPTCDGRYRFKQATGALRAGPTLGSGYPHHSILGLVNWPLGMQAKNPGEVLAHAVRDDRWNFYAWRNRWQDKDDVIISILAGATKGNYGCKAEKALMIQHGGTKIKWGSISGGFRDDFQPAGDGSTILTSGDGSCLAIDFSKASGADAMLVMTGPGAPAGDVVEAGGAKFGLLLLTKGTPPAPKAEGNRIVVGGQTVSLDGKRIVLGVFGK